MCSANKYAIDEMLSLGSPFVIAALLAPGLVIVNILVIFYKWHKDIYTRCVEMLRSEELSFQVVFSGALFKRWGFWAGSLSVLFFLMDFCAIKSNTAINGVVIGLVLYLQILSSSQVMLLLGLCCLSYLLMIYPAFIKWRITSDTK
jgi:hypothetical protein